MLDGCATRRAPRRDAIIHARWRLVQQGRGVLVGVKVRVAIHTNRPEAHGRRLKLHGCGNHADSNMSPTGPGSTVRRAVFLWEGNGPPCTPGHQLRAAPRELGLSRARVVRHVVPDVPCVPSGLGTIPLRGPRPPARVVLSLPGTVTPGRG